LTFLYDVRTGRRGEHGTTGNAGRGSYRTPPSVSTTNLVLEAGDATLDELVARAGDGLYVASVAGLHSGVNPVSGTFSVGATGRLIENGELEPLPMNRFRPNIVVAGWSEPHTEDRVLEATIGTVRIGYSARSIRCAVPRVDQATGERNGPEPTKTLSTYRRQPDYDGGVSFGMKAAVLRPGRVAVGDEFRVDSWLPGGEDPGAIAHNNRPGVRQG